MELLRERGRHRWSLWAFPPRKRQFFGPMEKTWRHLRHRAVRTKQPCRPPTAMFWYATEQGLTRIATAMGGRIQDVRDTITPCRTVLYQSTHIQGVSAMSADTGPSVVSTLYRFWHIPDRFIEGASNVAQDSD
jgi:hypothetical protein